MSTVISVENVSKSYRLGMIGGATLKEDFARWWAKARRKPDPLMKIGDEQHARRIGEQFWALKDISFEIKEGEVLGIIGRNGAGKSTLLKILSQVTAPTSGEIKIKGRIASLLEVGTGFHPELSGRENIFLNGAILGMTKGEIRRKFDEIVAFSGIEEFIDTPVKRYSSGMYVRLAFAVAAHLEPEILIVDEVLAVGDAAFQKKCLGKMKDVAGRGRTVIFVSHTMSAVKTLCSRAILLEGGRVQLDTLAEEAVAAYLNERGSDRYQAPASKMGKPHVARLWFSNSEGISQESFGIGEPVTVNAELHNPGKEALELALAFFDNNGSKLWNFTHEQINLPPITASPKARLQITFSPPPLVLQEVFVHVGLRVKGYHGAHYVDHITEGLRYLIEEPREETYRRTDSIIRCPVAFRLLPNDR